jgi:ATP-dependent helicase HrpB
LKHENLLTIRANVRLPSLPIDPYVPAIVARLRDSRAVVVAAAPGAGKTTRLAPALAVDGPVILLQPRRVAARSIARRIAEEQGWTVGREVGWQVRFERRFERDTRLLVATEGILTARLQQDPLLSDFRTIVLDEFHDRTVHADLGIGLAKQAWLARGDLRLVVMSATMDTAAVSAYLAGCPVYDVPGRTYPLDVAYQPRWSVVDAVRTVVGENSGNVLCFLPGAPEIRRVHAEVRPALGPSIDVVALHGSLEAAEQDRALASSPDRRVILATNIAETSLTVPGITVVVDTGLQKVARYDPDRAIDSLETERVSRDAADQRAGRAARLGPGRAIRLWSESDRLRSHREPDIHRIDLSGPLLDILAWGGDPATFDWFEAPAPDRVVAGIDLLQQLGAIDGSALTPLGRRMQALPLHPRLSRILIEGQGSRAVAFACAVLSERALVTGDLHGVADRASSLPPHVVRVAADLERLVGERGAADGRHLERALLSGYPDRVAKRREPRSPRVLLASGHGAVMAPESGAGDSEYLVALDVHAGRRGEWSEARIRLASAVDREWLTPTSTDVHHEIDRSGRVRAQERECYGALVLAERAVTPDPLRTSTLLAAAYLDRGFTPDDGRLLRRLRFAGLEVDPRSLVEQSAQGARSLSDIDITRALGPSDREALARLAPDTLVVPSGRSHALEYHEDGSVSASVKLQELFGLAETPVIGRRREPVLIRLLAPNGRPVQTTRDLRSFWERTYPEVRKELRGRYPKHPWPDDPWKATPTARTKKSKA